MNSNIVQIVCGAGIVSGKEIVCLHLARALRDAGFDAQVITSHWADDEFVKRLDARKFVFRRLWLGFVSTALRRDTIRWTLGQLRRWPALVAGYRRIIRDTAPRAVVHTDWHHALLLLPWLRRERDIFWSHDLVPDKAVNRLAFRLIARRTARIVCVSQAVARRLAMLGVAASQLVTIHNGVPPAASVAVAGGHDTLRLAIVGQIAPWKGHDDVLEALGLLTAQRVPVRLSIFGDGDAAFIARLRRRADELRLGELIAWRGFIAEQSSIYAGCDVVLVPSRTGESFGMTAAEAGAHGRPVICSNIDGLAEIVEQAVTGVLIEPNRPDQLAGAIGALADDPARIPRMGEAARLRVQREFSLTRFGAQFAALVESMPPGRRLHDLALSA